MFSINRVERIVIFLFAINLYGLVMAGDDLKDDNIDRGSRSDRGGLWFGPRLGKRSLRLVDDDNRQTFLRLLEAADALKYYYDQLSYESQADDPEMKVTKKVIFTPKLGRAVSVDFTPRLGRRLADDRVTPADQDNYRPEVEQMDRNKYFSPRLGRTMNFSPRLGREISYGFIGLIVSISNGQVLLASNVEEFRILAKKLVPENIADELVEIVSQNKYNHHNSEYQVDDANSKDDDVYYYDGYDDRNDEESRRDDQHESKPIARQGVNAADPEIINREPIEAKKSADPQRPEPIEVNLDDLVEKVRDKLLDNFQKNPTELQKLLGAHSVIANNETDRNENNKKLKLLRDRHDVKRYQQSRDGPKKKILRPQPINIERKDARDKPAQRISRPHSSKIKRNDAQEQTYKQDDLFEQSGPEISRPLSSIIDRTDAQGQVYEEADQPARYRPGPGILRPVSSNIDKKVAQGQTYYEEDDLLARFKPGSGNSRPLSSIIDRKDVLRQAYKKEDQPARHRPEQMISRPVSSNIERKDSQGQEYEEDGLSARYNPGPEISRPLRSNRPGSELSRPQSVNRERKDVEGQAYEEEVLPARYRPRQIISKPQSSNRDKKESKVQAYKEDELPEEDAEGNVRVPKDQRQTTESAFIFQEFNLNTKKNEKDTYEDYVTPKREDNIFSSEEAEITAKQAKSSLIWSQRTERTPELDIFNYKLQNVLRNSLLSQTSERTNPEIPVSSKNPSIYDDSNEPSTEPDLKARTENLWFDYKDEPIAKVKQKPQASANGETKHVKLGTMIPTRETYKMTSPNYYGQLPTVAEKYNFNEPIPEKDREREDLKPIGNPPANINGKIKV